MIQTRFILPAGALVLGLAIGLGAGWKLYRPKPAPVETAAPAVRQADKSLVLQRQPQAKPQPKHELPKGAKLERQIQVTVLPSIPTGERGIPGSGSLAVNNGQSMGNTDNSGQSMGNTGNHVQSVFNRVQSCAITVDLSLVRMPDGGQRVIASSPDGTVTGGLDIPVQGPMLTVAPLRWSGYVLRGYDAYRRQAVWGGAITYARGPFVATGGVIGQTAFVGIGAQF